MDFFFKASAYTTEDRVCLYSVCVCEANLKKNQSVTSVERNRMSKQDVRAAKKEVEFSALCQRQAWLLTKLDMKKSKKIIY